MSEEISDQDSESECNALRTLSPKGRQLRVLFLHGSPSEREWQMLPEGATVDVWSDTEKWQRSFSDTERWDVAWVLGSPHRLYSTLSDSQLKDFLRSLFTCARVAVIPARRTFIDPSATNLGFWEVPSSLASVPFISEISGTGSAFMAPLLILSEHLQWDGASWLTNEDCRRVWNGRAETDKEEWRRRTYRCEDETILKVLIQTHDRFFGDALEREEAFLRESRLAQGVILRPPNLLSWRPGHTLSILRRQMVPGLPLHELSFTSSVERQEVGHAVIRLAADFARNGIFHNDFRPWNLIWNGKEVTSVDFADVSNHDLDQRDLPQLVSVLGTVAWLLDLARPGTPIRLFEDFDSDVLKLIEAQTESHGLSIPELYGQPWIDWGYRNLNKTPHSLCSISDLVALFLGPHPEH